MIYLEDYRWFDKLKTGLTLDWSGGWGSRVWGMWMWCKEDWINLLSLQCAFIPNGSDMSRAQHYLPSHCTGRGRTHRKEEQEGVSEVDGATHEKDSYREREGESGSNRHPKNNHNPKHANILFHRHAVIAFPITPGPECICRSWETLLIRTARN